MTPLILTALAVAFAFRCGLFNIGGQGQYWVGFIAALFVGSHLEGLLAPAAHPPRARGVDRRRGDLGRDRRPPQGDRGRPRGDHDDHAQLDRHLRRDVPVRDRRPPAGAAGVDPAVRRDLRVGRAVADLGKPARRSTRASSSRSSRSSSTRVILNRTTLGFEVRAVGFNPEAARYSGISVAKNYFLAMAIAGAFAGLAGSVDLLGFKFSVDVGRLRRRTSSPSPASRSPCSGGRSRSASSSRRCSSPRSRSGRPRASSIPRCSSRRSRSTSRR